jgi:hypothetical protein
MPILPERILFREIFGRWLIDVKIEPKTELTKSLPKSIILAGFLANTAAEILRFWLDLGPSEAQYPGHDNSIPN